MEKPPQFLKDFSKEQSPEERQQTAQAIREKRAEYFAGKQMLTEKQTELERSMTEREQVLAEKLEAVSGLEQEISELTTSKLTEIVSYFKLKKHRADLLVGKRTYEELKQQQGIDAAEQESATDALGSDETLSGMQEAKGMLDSFYKSQKKKWANSEYTKEDIEKYFSEEHLSSLSLEEYALLLKRFPREMVAHVTRQGIRDHVGMIFHTAGRSKYADGFNKMIEDGRLRSPLGVYLIETEKEKALARFLHLDEFQNKHEAMDYLKTMFDGGSGSYVDRMAIHFATEEVADVYYGSEKGNEIFIAYPSAFIASQYYFGGQLKNGGGGYWNDQWVWANEERGMDLNAGLVFIPEETRVGKTTGSRYELDENKDPIINSEYQRLIWKVIDSADFHDYAEQALEISGKLSQRWNDPDLSPRNKETLQKLEPFRRKLEDVYGIKDKRLQYAILDRTTLEELDLGKRKQENGESNAIEQTINAALKRESIYFMQATDTVTSKEYWEARFATSPEKRPSKIVYYKDDDPTIALLKWRDAQGIHKPAADKYIGFSERHLGHDEPEATAGMDRFKVLAEKVIEDYYAQKEVVVA